MFNEIVRAMVELTDNKLIAAVVPVILGAGFLAGLFKLRDRQLSIRDESLKFVNETADLLNNAISPLFGAIRRRTTRPFPQINERIGDLFRHRLGTRARSLALLNSPEFWREYDAITWQLRECVDHICAVAELAGPRDELKVHAGPDWEQSLNTAKDIWAAAATLIEAGINRALRGKRPRFAPREAGPSELERLRND